METYEKKMHREIMGVKGVKRVNIGDVQREVIEISFTPEIIRRNGMLPMLIAQTLQSSIKVINSGKLYRGADRIAVNIEDGATSIEEIVDLLVSMPAYSAYARQLKIKQEYVFYRIRRTSLRKPPTSLR